MILTYKTNDGYIKAYISWNIINKDNVLVKNGEIIVINGAWIHEKHRNEGLLKQMMKDIFKHTTTKNSLYVLYSREKYNRPNRQIPIYKYFKYLKTGV